AVVAIVLGVLVLAGSRTLLFGHVPEVGGLRAWPGAGSAWSTFTASWRATMMGAGRAASPAFALMAASTATLLGHAGMARSLVIGGALPLGAFGAYRLVRSFAASALPGVAAAVAYAVNPIIRNAVWRGELGPIVCFALAPFLLGAFVRAVDPGAPRRARWHAAGTITLLGIACGAVWPPAIGFALLIAVAFCLALPFTGDAAVVKRGLVVGAGTTAAVAVLLAPWSLTLLGADAATFGAFPRAPLSLADLLRFHTGAAGAGLAPWGILAAAAVPLAFATGPRLTWSIRAWTLALASFALAWIPGRIDGGASVLSPDGVLIGAALGLAFAAGLGIAAILDDLRRFHFGWRQVMTVVGVVGLGWAMIGFAGDTLSGRFGLGSEDWPSTYSWMQDNPPPGGFRVLWLGDATVLPADAKVASGIGYATTLDGSGDARALWAAPAQHSDRAIGDALRAATSGTTARLGHLLAPAGVRYIAFVQRAAPHSGPYGIDQSALASALGRQLDLTLSRSDDSGVVYQNEAWMPMRSFIPPASASSLHIDGTDPASAAERSEAVGVKGVAVSGSRTEPIGPGTLLWSWAAGHGWHASANGRQLSRRDAFGWTNAFALDGSAPVRVTYRGDLATMVGRTLEIALWIGLIAAWFVTRRRSRRRAPAAGREQLVDLT
ncbi:MAG TPA: hypothetical protein VN636_06825, partial [Acidimicrobiia bacterium]|nr:hypothetical protein [Acidimicrobiia bacterium]